MTFQEFTQKYQKVRVDEFPNRVTERVPNPTVTVKVSAYQHAQYIRQCLDGILMQETEFPFEILIGEDESSDGTREICIEYARQHPELIRLFLNKRENNIPVNGKPSGRFQAIYTRFMARGKFLAFCEGDDFWIHPRKLALQVEMFNKTPALSMCAGIAKILTPGVSPSIDSLPEYTPPTKKEYYNFGEVFSKYFMHLSTFCIRNWAVPIYSWQMTPLNGDEVMLALHADKGPVGFIHEPLSVYRHHPKGIWNGASAEKKFKATRHTFSLLNKHFQGKYREVLDNRQFINLERCCGDLIEEGEFGRARRIVRETFPYLGRPYWRRLARWWLRLAWLPWSRRWGRFRVNLAFKSRLKHLFSGSRRDDSA